MFKGISARGFVLASCVLVAGLPMAARAQESFKYKWNKGDVLYYRTVQDFQGKVTAPKIEGESKSVMKEERVQKFEVKDVGADGAATVEVTYLSIKSEQDTGSSKNARTVYDSARDDPNSSQTAIQMSALIGEHYTATIEPNGTVRKVEGMAPILNKMAKTLESVNSRMMSNIRLGMNDDAIRGTLDRCFKVLPDKPVKQGDTWTSSFQQSIPMIGGRMKVDTTWTYQGMQKVEGADAAKFTSVYKLEALPPPESEGMKQYISIADVKGTGEVFFDTKAGHVSKSTIDLAFAADVSFSPDGKSTFFKNSPTCKIIFERIAAPATAPKTETPGEPKKQEPPAPAKDEKKDAEKK